MVRINQKIPGISSKVEVYYSRGLAVRVDFPTWMHGSPCRRGFEYLGLDSRGEEAFWAYEVHEPVHCHEASISLLRASAEIVSKQFIEEEDERRRNNKSCVAIEATAILERRHGDVEKYLCERGFSKRLHALVLDEPIKIWLADSERYLAVAS